MQSLKSRFYYLVTKRALAKSRRVKLPIPQGRAERDRQGARMFRKPAGLQIEPCTIGGVAGEWLRPAIADGAGLVLYLHGGAYVFGSTITHRGIASGLAIASRSAVLVINYRLAPEHPFPAGLDDAFAVYQALVHSHPGKPIALAGDSAGGGLALALAMKIRDAGVAPPVALALLSPWTDLTLSNPTHVSKAKVDPYFPDSTLLAGAAQAYAGGTPLSHPSLSPQFADLCALPATLIHVGELEALLDDSIILAQRLSGAGVSATVERYPGMWHVWQLLVGRIREADESIAALGQFLLRRLQGRVG